MDDLVERLRNAEQVLTADNWHAEAKVCAEAADLIAFMKDALEPFAKCADEIDYEDKVRSEGADEPLVTSEDEWAEFRLVVSDYRRARRAFNGEKS